MKSAPILSKSKLARHLLKLLLFCALLPLLSLSFFSYYQAAQNHTAQVFTTLQQNTGAVSQLIYKRLLQLEREMRRVAVKLIADGPGQVSRKSESLQMEMPYFKALGLLSSQGFEHQLFGYFDRSLLFELDLFRPFDNNKGRILVQKAVTGRPSVFMLLRPEPADFGGGILIAEINPDYLWSLGESFAADPATEISILDTSGQVLTSSIQQPRDLLANLNDIEGYSAGVRFSWKHEGQRYLASTEELLLQSRFQIPAWTVVLSRPKADGLSPGAAYKFLIPLVVLIFLPIVLLLGNNFIRKVLTPLEELKRGTRMLARGRFKYRVNIHSGDEFEEMGTAFHEMSKELRHRFKELSVRAKIGKNMANILSKDKLALAASNAMEKYLDFDRGMILMANEHNNRLYFAEGFGYSDDDVRRFKEHELDAFGDQPHDTISLAFKEQKSITLTKKAIRRAKRSNDLNMFLKSTGSQFIICNPIIYETESLGVLVLGRNNQKASSWHSDRKILTEIASQLAVRLSNIISYNKLMESEARFRKSFDYAASGIVLLDLNGYFMDVNEYFLNMLGYSEHELFGHTIFEFSHSEDSEVVSESLQRLRKGEIEFASYEQRFLNGGGQTCWSLVSTSLLHDSEGRPLHFISLYQDLTETKLTEKENVKLEARLQQAQKMEAIGTLAGGIAHDFNNILSGIMGYAQLGMMENDRDSNTYRWLQGVQEAGDRATDLVKQILTFSRQAKQERAPIQIHLIVKEALKLLRATLPLNIEIQEKIASLSGVVLADSTQIHQLVMNICTNAYHSMLDNGGSLEVSLQPDTLDPGTRAEELGLQPGSYLKLTIADTGCGMNEATLKKIFDPYFTTKEADKGTGLGLSVVHGIVESHGGAISVHSKLGKGTRFEVYFPQVVVGQREADEEVDSIPTGTEKILFVDDEGAVAETGKSILEKLGYRVEAHTDPQKALNDFAAHNNRFDLVITDMSMPSITGAELSQKLLEIRPDIPILLCSGYSDQVDTDRAEAIGVKKFLAKPLETGKLASIIRQVLDEDAGSLAN